MQVEVIHNASIMGAAASCGLQLYNFGQTISLCLWDKEMDWTPSSFYEKIAYNRKVCVMLQTYASTPICIDK
jgi:diphthine methyl ester synthase